MKAWKDFIQAVAARATAPRRGNEHLGRSAVRQSSGKGLCTVIKGETVASP